VALACAPRAIESALVEALVARGHSVTLLGNDKRPVAARWPTLVTEAIDSPQARREADLLIVVDERVALRPASSEVDMPRIPSCGGARRVVLITPFADVATGNVPWMVIQVDAVFGPSSPADDLVSALLALVRTLPVAPEFPGMAVKFAPLFAHDLAALVVRAIETEGAWGRVHHARGADVVDLEELARRLAVVADKKPLRPALPAFLTGVSGALLHLFGMKVPVPGDAALARLDQRATSSIGEADAAADLGVSRTPLDEALERLASSLPEQLPTQGYGGLSHKRFWIDIDGSTLAAEALLEEFRANCRDIMPITFDVENGVERSDVVRGRTLTASLPLRGHIQMRVQETLPRRITFATVEGHPIAGVVRFMTGRSGSTVRFVVEVYARSSTPFDFVALRAGGAVVQDLTWKAVCRRMLERSQGTSKRGVQHDVETLGEADAERAAAWIEELVARREREEHEADLGG